jgi:hypothetical protein
MIMQANELYEVLARQGIRIFVLKLGHLEMTYIHPQKTTEEWRQDVRSFVSETNSPENGKNCSDDDIYNGLIARMSEAGYLEVADVAADVYEGRIVVLSASIKDHPIHREQADGFGHYGWESKDVATANEGD